MHTKLDKMIAYYAGSEVKIIHEHHPHFLAVGEVTGVEETTAGPGLKIKRFDTQEQFFIYDTQHLRITKRK